MGRLLLLLLVLAPAPALAGDAYGYVFEGFGYRRSLAAGGGLDLRVGVGAFGRGALGLELDSSWFADHTFSEAGTEVRSTNWLTLQVRTNTDTDDAAGLAFAVGPGMGWVRPKGEYRTPDRAPSIGAKQVVRFDFLTEDDALIAIQLRGEVMELWQPGVVASPDIHVFLGMHVGLAFSP